MNKKFALECTESGRDCQTVLAQATLRWKDLIDELVNSGGVMDINHLKRCCESVKLDWMCVMRLVTSQDRTVLHKCMAEENGHLFLSRTEMSAIRAKQAEKTAATYEKVHGKVIDYLENQTLLTFFFI